MVVNDRDERNWLAVRGRDGMLCIWLRRGGLVVVITDAPARRGLSEGFSARMYSVVAALSERWTVVVGAVLGTPTQGVCGAVSAHDFVDPDLEVREVVGIDADAARRASGLQSLIERVQPSLVVVHHVLNTQMVDEVPAGTPVVFAFEEGAGELSRWAGELRPQTRERKRVAAQERRRERHLYRRVVRRAALCIAISKQEAARMRSWAPAARPAVVKHGVDCAVFSPRAVDDPAIDVAVVACQRSRATGTPGGLCRSRRSPAADVRG